MKVLVPEVVAKAAIAWPTMPGGVVAGGPVGAGAGSGSLPPRLVCPVEF